jgi:hypothetical protein
MEWSGFALVDVLNEDETLGVKLGGVGFTRGRGQQLQRPHRRCHRRRPRHISSGALQVLRSWSSGYLSKWRSRGCTLPLGRRVEIGTGNHAHAGAGHRRAMTAISNGNIEITQPAHGRAVDRFVAAGQIVDQCAVIDRIAAEKMPELRRATRWIRANALADPLRPMRVFRVRARQTRSGSW